MQDEFPPQTPGGKSLWGKPLAVGGAIAVALVGLLASNVWLRSQPPVQPALSRDGVHSAYARVIPGHTQAPDLAGLGFDIGCPGVKRVSYLGLMEYFAPRSGAAFDRLDPAAQKCLTTPEGCSAYVFRLASEHAAGLSLVSRAEAAPGDVEVLFLIHDGRVAYKAISGG